MTGTLRVGAAVLALALGLGGGVLALASRTAPELPCTRVIRPQMARTRVFSPWP